MPRPHGVPRTTVLNVGCLVIVGKRKHVIFVVLELQAMNDLVRETLDAAQRALRKTKSAGNAAMIDDAVSKMSDQDRAKVNVAATVV